MKTTFLLRIGAHCIIGLALMAKGDGTNRPQSQVAASSEPDTAQFGWGPPRKHLPPAYMREATRLILQEANQIAKALQMPERLPITESNLTERYLSPLRFAVETGGIGNVTTPNYVYCVSFGMKLGYVIGKHQLEDCTKWGKDYLWDSARMDTNAAYALASQWLAAVSMDVAALNRDYRLFIKPDNFYVRPPPGKFVPVYVVTWCKPSKPNPDIIIEGNLEWESVASVMLFLPTKTLMQLRVEDPRYNLRPPVTSTNLEAFLAEAEWRKVWGAESAN